MAFIFGGNTGTSYEDMMRRRAMSDAYMQSMGTPQTYGEGLSALGKGLAAGLLGRSANKMEKEGKAAAQERAQSVLGQLYGARLQPASYSPAPQASTGAVQPQTPGQAVASDTMAALGKQDGGWLKYSNDGAIRNDPIAPELQTAMSFLPEMGVTMEVFSGGQEPAGAGGSRTGSTRHDHGNAADVFFYKDGRRLDWNNPQDRPLFEEIVKRGKAAGVTGFGAGDGYMQAGSMHVGFGNPGVWGAGGKGENAADWLQAAYNGTEAPPVVKVAGGGGQIDPTAAMQSMGAGMDPAAVMAAISDPFLDEGTRNVLGMLFQQQIQRQNQMTDPAYQMQLEASRLANQKAQMEIAQFGQPQVPETLTERKALAQAAGIQPGTPEYQAYMATGELPVPGGGSEFGLTPIYGRDENGNVVVMQLGKDGTVVRSAIPEGVTPDLGVQAQERARGTEIGKQTGAAVMGLDAAQDQAAQSLALIESIRNDPALPSITGSIQGGLLPAGIPLLSGGQAGADLGVKIEQLQGTAFLQAFESLKGAGQITEIEGQKAEAAIARLRRAQSTEAYKAALDDLATIIRGGLGRSQAKAGVAPQAAPTAAPQGAPQGNDPLGLFK